MSKVPDVAESSVVPFVLCINQPLAYQPPKEAGKSGSINYMGGSFWVKDPSGKLTAGNYNRATCAARIFNGKDGAKLILDSVLTLS